MLLSYYSDAASSYYETKPSTWINDGQITWFFSILLKIPLTMKPEDNSTDSAEGILQIDVGRLIL